MLISVCDKLQSARELKRQVRLRDLDAYEAFKGAGEDRWEREHNVFWFHCELSKAFQARLNVISKDLKGPIIKAIQAYIDEFDDIVGWLDR